MNPQTLEIADRLISLEDDIDLEKLYTGLRLAKLTLTEEMVVILLEVGYEMQEIADFRNVSLQAIYSIQKKILKKINGSKN
jgi:DNA-binding NarL/FixJ family response regulator